MKKYKTKILKIDDSMLILASKSSARKAILKNLGIKFKVVPSNVKEQSRIFNKAPYLVARENALLKARDVAARIKKGIVIGCDTVVWQAGRMFGKPKNISDARKILKRLSSAPHRLYTGIAVIDAERKKEIVDFEETKIIMEPLSYKEIDNYFKKVSPLDKAGGFDVQGLGGVFIKRINGCYFNVVGLPLAKLNFMLKKIGISLLILICSFSFFGCATEFNVATEKQDWMVYSSDAEVNMGDSVSKQVEKDYTLINDPELNERVNKIGQKIVAVCDRKELLYRFRIIEDKKDKDIVNAVSLPGGYVYVFKNLIKVANTDDELSAVLAHEVAHIVARHSIKRLQAIWGYNILSMLAVVTGDAGVANGAQTAYLTLLMGYSQEDELTADKLGARYAKRAGYNASAMLDFLKKLGERYKKEPPQPLSYFKTHPNTRQRLRAVKEELGEKISFDDFINTN